MSDKSATKLKTSPSPKTETKQVPIPPSLQWAEEYVAKCEEAIVHAPWEDLIGPLYQGVQQLGIADPPKALGDSLDQAVAKVKRELLTDGLTRFRPTVHNTLVYLVAIEPVFQLDVGLIIHAAVKLVIGDVVKSLASATINRATLRDLGTENS